jgi:hypothetical protein
VLASGYSKQLTVQMRATGFSPKASGSRKNARDAVLFNQHFDAILQIACGVLYCERDSSMKTAEPFYGAIFTACGALIAHANLGVCSFGGPFGWVTQRTALRPLLKTGRNVHPFGCYPLRHDKSRDRSRSESKTLRRARSQRGHLAEGDCAAARYPQRTKCGPGQTGIVKKFGN